MVGGGPSAAIAPVGPGVHRVLLCHRQGGAVPNLGPEDRLEEARPVLGCARIRSSPNLGIDDAQIVLSAGLAGDRGPRVNATGRSLEGPSIASSRPVEGAGRDGPASACLYSSTWYPTGSTLPMGTMTAGRPRSSHP